MAGQTSEALVEVRPEEELDPEATAFHFTQYGVKMPDGTDLWAPLTISVLGSTLDAESIQTTREGAPFHGLDLVRLEEERRTGNPGPVTEDFRAALWALAGSVYMDPEAYGAGVSVVLREVTVAVGDVRASVPSAEHLRVLG